MILGANRKAVIENIRTSAQAQDLHAKVEINDPVLTPQQCKDIAQGYLSGRHAVGYRRKAYLARTFANLASKVLNTKTEYVIHGDLSALDQGCILTCNHFNPLDHTPLRTLVRKHKKKRLNIVSQMGNFAGTGPIGALLRYADTIPLWEDPRYLSHEFLDVLGGLLKNKEPILIYPEQEMWFNYRKPRSLKRGAYLFAAKLQAPVVCCFVEMVALPKKDTKEFKKVRYVLHILDTLYPDPEKNPRQNSIDMCKKDYELKKAAYEKAYGKPLTYDFSYDDIAGWIQ